MSLDAGKILGIKITKNPSLQILKYIEKYLGKNHSSRPSNASNAPKPLIIVTPNPEQIVYAQSDEHFAKMVNEANVALPDGVGVVWAIRLLHAKSVQKAIPGVECMEELVSRASKRSVPIRLIGGRAGLAVRALECLQKKYQNLSGEGQDAPDMVITGHELRIQDYEKDTDMYFQNLAKTIVTAQTQMVFVGLGAPKQEYFIEQLRDTLIALHYRRPIVLMSVGGSFDEISGRLPAAPVFMKQLGLKWLWRLFLEPRRLGRQIRLIEFVFLVLKERFQQT